jgi:RNA polymerase sigma-70 factor (ECF subfamily)
VTEDRVAERHRGTFGAQVAAELPGLYRYARSITDDEAEAQDLVGDTVVRALERAAQYRSEASLRTWLHQILYHIAVDRARRHSHELSVDDVEAQWRDDTYSVDAEDVLERAESAAELRDALVHVPHHYRNAVVLHDAEGFPTSEVAAVLGISLAAAKQRIRRGRMMLVSALSRREERRRANVGVPLGCWEARQQVSGYIDGELDPAERRALEAHLAGCATCPPLYQALVGTTASLGNLHDPDSVIPEALAERVRRHLGLEAPTPERAVDTGSPSAGEVWDRRFAEERWPSDPDPFLVELAQHLPAGRGLDLGSGPGRNSLWLAARGWDMVLLDASQVALGQAAAAAGSLGVTITTVHADLAHWTPEEAHFDLVVVANLHPGPDALAAILHRASQALRPGGHLYLVGHHIAALGRHGPPDPERLFTDERLRAALPAELVVEVLETRDRRADHGHAGSGDEGARRDTVVVAWATRPSSPGARLR